MDAGESPLHALVDLRWMRPGVAGGIENLSRSFVDHLAELGTSDRYTVLAPSEVRYDFATRGAGPVRVLAVDGPRDYLRRIVRSTDARTPTSDLKAREHIDALRVDVALSIPGYIHPDLASLRNVEIMPDLQHEYLKEFFSPQALDERRRIYSASAAQAAHICAMSEFTRQTLLERMRLPSDRVTTTHLAPDPMFHPGSAARRNHRRVLERHRLTAGDYLLFPANTWPHKNHTTAIEALRIVRETSGLDPLLVCAGAPKQSHPELLAQVKASGLESRVRFLGYCHPSDLPALYQGAAALVFPSLFEGFGLPPIEAMWCDCPVVCSDVTSLPEIVGDAAVMIDPRAPEALAHAIQRVLTDHELRCRLIASGRARVTRFSWAKFTREMVSVLHQVRPRRSTGRAEPPPTSRRRWSFDRAGRARAHLRQMTESWALGETGRAFSHGIAGTLLAPQVTFSVGLYPTLRDRVLERIVGRLEERQRQQRRIQARTEPWSDRWVGPRLVLEREMTHTGGSIALSGWANLRHVKRPFVLTVCVDGDLVGRRTLAKSGRFVARIPLTGPLAPGKHTVEVEASASWTPNRYLRNGDIRPLAWRMYVVRFDSGLVRESKR